jgi:hypothetical protein
MSLDISLVTPTRCPHCGGELYEGGGGTTLFEANITHNVAPMWIKAGVYGALYHSDGQRARDFIVTLRAGVADMEKNYAEYEKLNSPNGWGLAETALPWLRTLLRAVEQDPGAIIRVSS